MKEVGETSHVLRKRATKFGEPFGNLPYLVHLDNSPKEIRTIYYCHFEETVGRKYLTFLQSHTASKWWFRDVQPRLV